MARSTVSVIKSRTCDSFEVRPEINFKIRVLLKHCFLLKSLLNLAWLLSITVETGIKAHVSSSFPVRKLSLLLSLTDQQYMGEVHISCYAL